MVKTQCRWVTLTSLKDIEVIDKDAFLRAQEKLARRSSIKNGGQNSPFNNMHCRAECSADTEKIFTSGLSGTIEGTVQLSGNVLAGLRRRKAALSVRHGRSVRKTWLLFSMSRPRR